MTQTIQTAKSSPIMKYGKLGISDIEELIEELTELTINSPFSHLKNARDEYRLLFLSYIESMDASISARKINKFRQFLIYFFNSWHMRTVKIINSVLSNFSTD